MKSELVFGAWWQALAAVPSSLGERDWWAGADDRRPRYDRLWRVWGDPTDSLPPPFYRLAKEKHLVPVLWENFVLFEPAQTIAALYAVLGFQAERTATDLCWSCEFNLGHQDRQLDIVLHVRFPHHDEIVIGEAKAGKKRFDPKDLDAEDALGRQQFRRAQKHRYFLLGDAEVPKGWRRGRMTWSQLGDLQVSLCRSLPEPPEARDLVVNLLVAQFAAHGISCPMAPPVASVAELEARSEQCGPLFRTERCRNFVASACQHLRCLAGLKPTGVPFAYLSSEPIVGDIRPGWRADCGKRTANEEAYWRLPARREAATSQSAGDQ